MTGLQVEPQSAGRLVSVTSSNEPLRDVLMNLARQSGLNLAIDPDVRGVVSVELQEVTFAQALAAILPPLGYVAQRAAGVMWIGRPELVTRTFELSFLNAKPIVRRLDEAKDGLLDARARRLLWDDLRQSLEALIFGSSGSRSSDSPASPAYARGGPQGRRLILQPQTGIIMVRDTPATLAAVETLLARLKRAARRRVVLVSVVVEFARQRGGGSSIPSTALGAIEATNLVISRKDIPEILAELAALGKVNVIARPRLLVSNNQRAILRLQHRGEGQDAKSFIGLELVVAPNVSEDGSLSMILHPVLQSARGTGGVESGELDTVVVLRQGETLVLGGLLRDAPELAESASGEQAAANGEVLILLRPTILVDEEGEPRGRSNG